MVVFVQRGFIPAKVVVFVQSGCIRAKWLYSGKEVVVFGLNWLYSGKKDALVQKWFYSEKSGFIRKKVVAFGQKRLYSGICCCIQR